MSRALMAGTDQLRLKDPHLGRRASQGTTGPMGGGIVVSFVDGHVSFIANGINFNTYRALSTRNNNRLDNEVIPSGNF